MSNIFENPFRPGAGQMPPFLAGRDKEANEFRRLLSQDRVLTNLILTGLRGVGKTVLLETLKPEAIRAKWLWAGTDLSESTSVSEQSLAIRLLTDLAIATSNIVIARHEVSSIGYVPSTKSQEHKLNFHLLDSILQGTPGLMADKLRTVLEFVWSQIQGRQTRGIVLAYDEAQNMTDHPAREQYPLSLLLDVSQSVQRKGMRFLLVLTGLPTLFPKLVETRTFSERMFHIETLGRLGPDASRDAILKPIEKANCPVKLSDSYVKDIVKASGGYPYFIQFICREVYDVAVQKVEKGQKLIVPMDDIIRKLDADFFAGRWARVTDRQRDLLRIIASLDHCDEEFTVQEIVDRSKAYSKKPFGASHVNQMLSALSSNGIIYKNRHGRYSFAVPLLGEFIRRQPDAIGGSFV